MSSKAKILKVGRIVYDDLGYACGADGWHMDCEGCEPSTNNAITLGGYTLEELKEIAESADLAESTVPPPLHT